jgi:hypothetical protein
MLRAGLSPDRRFLARTQLNQLRAKGPVYWTRWNAMLARAWTRDRLRRRGYTVLDDEQVRSARRSERVFVFGSGASLNELVPEEWEHFAQDDVLGFNLFLRQEWVRADFHLLRGGIYDTLRWRPFALEVAELLRTNPCFENTILLLQGDEYLAQFTNQLVGFGLLPEGSRIFRYRTARAAGPPTRSLSEGVRHTHGTLADAVNLAALLGWREIVLVGVDLYDSRYFFLEPDQTHGVDVATGLPTGAERNPYRGTRYDEVHGTARAGVVELMGEWREALAADGVELSVYNPRSLLAEVMPVYERRA